ncbi:MAG: DUF72 domain-containing protein [Actinobacteria bacterium]|nr:DUF72 domain-containing protein [Actinomycetota bacterium]
MAGTFYLGTSGFSYQEWKGPFYPEGLRDREMLSFLASRFPSVEINYTFRQQPSERTLAGWVEETPPSFRFSLKGHQRITHWMRLAGADEAVSSFLDRARQLGDRLGPILFQCPPSLRFDRSLIESFVGYLPPIARFAMEFRHPSWEEARPILAAQGVAWCTAETDETGTVQESWKPFGYLRLRKLEYTDDELKAWADRIGTALADGRDVYCYLKHEEKAVGPRFAERLAELTGLEPPG